MKRLFKEQTGVEKSTVQLLLGLETKLIAGKYNNFILTKVSFSLN